MVSESIRQRLMPIIMEKLLTLAPGYTGSRISYRDSFRDSVDIDSLPEEYYKNSQINISKESDVERLILLLIGRAILNRPVDLLHQLARQALTGCLKCSSSLRASYSACQLNEQPATSPTSNGRMPRPYSTISIHPECCANQHRALLGSMEHWVGVFPRDFAQREFLDRFNQICSFVGEINLEDEPESRRLRWRANNAITSPEPSRRHNFHNKSMSLIRKKHSQHNSVKTFSPIQKLSAESPEVLSEHLTYLELNQMDRITPDEIVQMVMAREQGGITLSNVNQYVQFSNRISLLVATEILSNSKVADRVSLIEFFMDTALACCRLGNFNSCMAITAGLSLPVVSRLSKTWHKVEETKFRVLQHICCPDKNFQNYRVILKVYGSDSRVMIPIFSVFLKDCFFRLKPCVEGCSESEIELKYWEDLTRPIAEFDSWRSKRIQLTKREKLITYISSTNIHEESSLFRCSFDIEGPNNSYERSQRRKMN